MTKRGSVDADHVQKHRFMSKKKKRFTPIDPSSTVPIRIHVDTNHIQSQNMLTQQQKDFLTESVLPVSQQYFEQRLKVNSQNIPWYWYSDETCSYKIDNSIKDFQGHLWINAQVKNVPNESWLAVASACYLSTDDNRPIIGYVTFNQAKLDTDMEKFQDTVKTAIHEMMHVMGFSSNLFNYFIDKNGNQIHDAKIEYVNDRGQTVWGLNTPGIKEYGSRFYGCDELKPIQLENDGGSGSAGSHLERLFFFNEAMTASDYRTAQFSGFSLKVLEDSGWYEIEERQFENFSVGKGHGCDWFKACDSEVNKDYFCKEDGCTYDFAGSGYCNQPSFLKSDNCKVITAYSNRICSVPFQSEDYYRKTFGCHFGDDSRCLQSDIRLAEKSSMCMKAKCLGDGIQVIVGKQVGYCKKGDQVITFSKSDDVVADIKYSGQITCPSYQSFCKGRYEFCPNRCSGKGYCKDGFCECLIGFGGLNCNPW